jgi:hypothetical protein
MQTDWFKALEQLQHSQDIIDINEMYELSYEATTNPNGVQDKPELLLKKNVGRPPTHWKTVNKVLDIFDKNLADVEEGLDKRLSLRSISKLLNNEISFFIVRKVLTRYRPQQYTTIINKRKKKKCNNIHH